MSAYTPLFISDDWSYGEFFERLLKNSQAPLPDWSIAREHIRTVFFRLHSMYLPELIKATNTLIPFRPVHPHPSRDDSPLDLERRSHFLTSAFFHAVCDAVDANLSAYRENTAALLMVTRELPRLRALLGAIQRIVWTQPKQHLDSHFTAPSEEFTRPALNNIEDSLNHLDLEQLAVTINLLGGWDMAKLAVEAHFHLKFPSHPQSSGFPSADELKEHPNVENLVENEAVRVLEQSLAEMRMNSTIVRKINPRVSSKKFDNYRQRKENERRMKRRKQNREIKTNGVLATSLSEFSRLSKSSSNSSNSSRSSSRSGGSTYKLAPIGSKSIWEENDEEIRQFSSEESVDSGSYSSTSPSISSSGSQWELDIKRGPLFESLTMKNTQRKSTSSTKARNVSFEQIDSCWEDVVAPLVSKSSVWSDSDVKTNVDDFFNTDIALFPSL